MKKVMIFVLLLAFCSNVFSQDDPFTVPRIIPASPNAAALEKFSSIPVDYSTGIPSISYPIWSWQRGKLSYSIGLSYHAGGHKIEDMASNVGLGWTMSGIGRISRTVRGLNDDDLAYGFLNTDPVYDAHTFLYDENEYYNLQAEIPYYDDDREMITALNSSAAGEVTAIIKGQLDGEQDLFSISFNGLSCRFVIDRDENIVPLEHTNIKIEMQRTIAGGLNSSIISFKVTDDKGLVYYFDQLESQISTVISSSMVVPPPPVQGYYSGWLLSKVKDPSTNDSIIFNYTNTTKEYEAGFSQSQSMGYGVPYYNPELAAQFLSPVWGSPQNSFSYNQIIVGEPVIKNVQLPDGSKILFKYDSARLDFDGDSALTRIMIVNMRNDTIKRYRFNYSYYYSPDETFSVESENNYQKRLRLDKAEELSTDGAESKPTIFSYNSLPLNQRNSRNIDYWGYNVNSARNNLEYVPTIPLKTPEVFFQPDIGLYLSGADRKPDSVYVKAGILEKIQYPTGGTTSFEYECNRAFSEINYYEDKRQTSTYEWYADFGDSYSFVTNARVDSAVEFLFKTEEFEERPEYDPENPQGCFEQSQDMQMAQFDIWSTDSSFHEEVEASYGSFLGGLKTIINLPPDKSFTIKFSYDTTLNCSFSYPFMAYAYGIYYIPLEDKLAGGLRIKKIVSADSIGNRIQKFYFYNDSSGHSSAKLNVIPNFDYYRSTYDAQDHEIGGGASMHIKQISRSSSPIYALDFFNGAPLIYKRVIEMDVDSGRIERQYDPIYADSVRSGYPYIPLQQFPQLSGLLKKEIVIAASGETKSEKLIYYKKSITALSGVDNLNIKGGTVASAKDYPAEGFVTQAYNLSTAYAMDTLTVSRVYENGNMLSQTEKKTYDIYKHYLRGIITTDSRNIERHKALYYSFDGIGTVYSKMIADNMLNYLMLEQNYVPAIVNGNLNTKKINYQLWNNDTLPMPASIESAILENGPAIDATFDAYDNKGNILQYTAKDGIVNSFIWGYNKQYPVAKVIGKSYSDAVSQSSINLNVVNAPSSESALKTELNKLRTLSGCFVTTITYTPLVGITSQTDPNGIVSYYEYDNFNRLHVVRDKDSNVVKKICYNYYGQPVSCGYGTLAAWQVISSVCEVVDSNFTGNLIVTEKDMNPSSGTYGNTRTTTISDAKACPDCSEEGKKVVSGICETGTKVCTGSYFVSGQGWFHYYHYIWSDLSTSSTFTGAGIGCEGELEL